MIFHEHVYSVLIVSSSDKFSETLRGLLPASAYQPVVTVPNAAAARRKTATSEFDIVIVNTPLTDEFGTELALDMGVGKKTVCLMLVKSELHDEIYARVVEKGIFTLSKPTSAQMLRQAISWLTASRERLRSIEEKTRTLEDKMEEIRMVNRAKWLLIDRLRMSESDAHRYIEKRAMDECVTRQVVAKDVIRTYQI